LTWNKFRSPNTKIHGNMSTSFGGEIDSPLIDTRAHPHYTFFFMHMGAQKAYNKLPFPIFSASRYFQLIGANSLFPSLVKSHMFSYSSICTWKVFQRNMLLSLCSMG